MVHVTDHHEVMSAILRNLKKLKALVHYVASRCENPSVLGSIKLNKVLWVSDLWSYVKTGQPITGEIYIKQQFGPVASSSVRILDELQSEGKIVVRRRELPNGRSKVDYISMLEPDLKMFTASEISLVDQAIDFVCLQHTSRQISDKSHDVIWELAEIGEEIPYYAMLASRLDGITKEDVTWAAGAHKRAREL